MKRVETPKPKSAPSKAPKSILKTSLRKDSKEKQLIFASPDQSNRSHKKENKVSIEVL